MMDTLLCDELVQEIFHRLPPSSSAAACLVSKRWLRLLRCSVVSLSLNFPPPYDPTSITSLSNFLSDHPFLHSLSISTASSDGEDGSILLPVASSCPKLRFLSYLSNPVSPFSLIAISASCAYLSSLSISISRPLSFHWLRFFTSLKSLSLFLTNPLTEFDTGIIEMNDDFDVELELESLSLSGISSGDYQIGVLWRNCKNIKKLQLKNCESLGDYSSFSGFIKSLQDLQDLELRSCRNIVDGVMFKLAQTCVSLNSLLIHDGGSKDGLSQFITHSKCNLKNLDLRLPLDLDNSHLLALSENSNFSNLSSLRLRSCCLASDEGLKALSRTISHGLEELALVKCDVIERNSGLLTSLGQQLKRLRKLDLSYNDMLMDKEMTSMLASCSNLVELKLKGCSKLSYVVIVSIIRCCEKLQHVDITYCNGIEINGVELLLLKSLQLRSIKVEKKKLSMAAMNLASSRFIEVLS